VDDASGDGRGSIGIERTGNGLVSHVGMGDLAGSGTHVWVLDRTWHRTSWMWSEGAVVWTATRGRSVARRLA
jgi:hypothetical protein